MGKLRSKLENDLGGAEHQAGVVNWGQLRNIRAQMTREKDQVIALENKRAQYAPDLTNIEFMRDEIAFDKGNTPESMSILCIFPQL